MSTHRNYRMLVALDLTEGSDIVLETALDAISRYERAELHVVSVLDASRAQLRTGRDTLDSDLQAIEEKLQEMVAGKLADFGADLGHGPDELSKRNIFLHARLGKPAEQIADLAWEAEVQQIVIGRHSGKEPWFSRLGSVPTQILRLARCPVLVVQPTDYGVTEDLDEQRARQCPECVTVRRDSEGGRWFCEEHSDYKVTRRLFMAHSSGTWPIGGGPLL